MYTIYWTDKDGYYAKKEFVAWWDAIGYIVSQDVGLNTIACSDNDTVSIYEFNHITQKLEKTIYLQRI